MEDPLNPNDFKEYIQPEEELVIPSRLSVVEYVYHQLEGGQPVAIEARFSRILDTDEQLYVRNLVATGEWKKLDTGWLIDCGMLILKNDEGQYIRIPTPEEKQEVEKRIIQLAVAEPAEHIIPIANIPIGETCRFQAYDLAALRVKCLYQQARCTLTLIPK